MENNLQKTFYWTSSIFHLYLSFIFLFTMTVLTLVFARVAVAESVTTYWNPVVDDIRVTGYEIHYGLASREYQWTVDASANGATTNTANINNLDAGNTYYLAIRSVNHNTSEKSPFSEEVSFTITSTESNAIQIPGLIAAYSFEDSDSSAVMDSSGNANHGTNSGAIHTTTGQFGSAMSFDGINDMIKLNTMDIVGGSGLTISAWMKADDFGIPDARLVSKATGVNEVDHYWMVSTFRNNSIRFRLKSGGSTTTLISNKNVITAGVWHHIAVTYDGDMMRIYVDGSEVGSTKKSGAINTNSSVLAAIGAQPQGDKLFDGLIDEVRLYNSPLTVEQIQTDMTVQIDSSNRVVTSGESGSSESVGNESESSGFENVGNNIEYPQMEFNEVEADYQWQYISFEQPFAEVPIVVTNAFSSNDETPATVRIRNIDETGFEIRVQEWNYLNDTHGYETVSYLAMEAGNWELKDGTRIEANYIETNATTFWESVLWDQSFTQIPVVIASVATNNGDDAVITRLRNITSTEFEICMFEQEANSKHHVFETISYIAWEPSSGEFNGIRFEVDKTLEAVTHQPYDISYQESFVNPPALLANMQTTNGADTANLRWLSNSDFGAEIRVQEERSKDSETNHNAEVVGYMSFEL